MSCDTRQDFPLTLFQLILCSISAAMWHWRIRWGAGSCPKLQKSTGCIFWWLSSPSGFFFRWFNSWVSNRLRFRHGIWDFEQMVCGLQWKLGSWKMLERGPPSKWPTILCHWSGLLRQSLRRPSLRSMSKLLARNSLTSKRFASGDSKLRSITPAAAHDSCSSLSNIRSWPNNQF